MRKREFEKLLQQAIIEEAEEQGAIFEASPETEPIPETAQARFDAALNGKRRPNRSVFTRLRYFAYRNGRRLAFCAIAAGTVAALVLVVGLLTRTVLNGKKGGSAPEKGESAPENSDHASTSAPVRTSEPGPLETNEPEGTTEPSAVDALAGCFKPFTPPSPEDADAFLKNYQSDIDAVVNYLESIDTEDDSLYLNRRYGTMVSYEFQDHDILSADVRASIQRLWSAGCEIISMQKDNNTVRFEIWSRTMGDVGCGISRTLDGQGFPKVQFQTKCEPISDGWFYYYTDYEEYRSNRSKYDEMWG